MASEGYVSVPTDGMWLIINGEVHQITNRLCECPCDACRHYCEVEGDE